MLMGPFSVDVAADIEGVPVPWFREHALVNRKQFSSRIEKSHELEVEFVGMGAAEAQTLYAGKRPNLIRIYNKLAEWRLSFKKLERDCKRFNAGMSRLEMSQEQMHFGARVPPTFEEFCRADGYEYKEGKPLTRIERQIGGGRIPIELTTFGDPRHAHDLPVFKYLRLVGMELIQQIEPPPEGIPIHKFLAAIGFQEIQKQLGSAQRANSYVLKYGNRNGKTILESLAECAPTTRQPLTVEEIQESYRKSTSIQTLH
jgi:hypothetical protein